ncbi:MAG: transcriptional regulator NrdR, partial [Clostridia bacterium]
MGGLKEVDEVAYIRFAAVYRKFKDSTTFFEEMSKIFDTKGNIEKK